MHTEQRQETNDPNVAPLHSSAEPKSINFEHSSHGSTKVRLWNDSWFIRRSPLGGIKAVTVYYDQS